jgi:hypothetical protein
VQSRETAAVRSSAVSSLKKTLQVRSGIRGEVLP